MSVDVEGGKLLVHCFAGCDQDEVWSAIVAMEFATTTRLVVAEPARAMDEEPRRTTHWGHYVIAYPYHNENGHLLYEKLRYPKGGTGPRFAIRRPTHRPGWYLKGQGRVEAVPYRLPELMAADPEAPVLMTEGEKSADRLAALGVVVTVFKYWQPHWNKYIRGRRVIVFPDNDASGEKYATDAAVSLKSCARRVVIMRLPGLPAGGDVFDYVDAGHGGELIETISALQ